MNPTFWTSEKLLSLSALLVSLLTLIVFMYQTDLIREQQYRSVYPHLNLANKASGSLDYQYVLINEGIGPAFIKSITVEKTNGDAFENLTDYLYNEISIEDSIWVYNSDLYPGKLVPAKEEVILFGLVDEETVKSFGRPPNTLEGANKLRSTLNSDSLSVEITYESIYGEQWSITNDWPIPKKL